LNYSAAIVMLIVPFDEFGPTVVEVVTPSSVSESEPFSV
jgi:hypothetical protein